MTGRDLMGDHGCLDDFQAEQALGAMVLRVVKHLEFSGPGALATTGFSIDDTRYEISVTVKPS